MELYFAFSASFRYANALLNDSERTPATTQRWSETLSDCFPEAPAEAWSPDSDSDEVSLGALLAELPQTQNSGAASFWAQRR